MEMVRMPRGRRVREPSYSEPLLEIFEDEYLAAEYGRRNRRGRRGIADRTQPILSSSSTYRPPQYSDDRMGQWNSSTSVRRGHRMASPHSDYIHRSVVPIRNQSPIVDQSNILSHGCFCVRCVRSQELGVIENFGEFQELLGPGMHVMCWPYTGISSFISLRIQQLDIVCETKTRDNVFVHLQVVVQYRVIAAMAYFAHYRLEDPHLQIRSYVFDVVRATVPLLTVDELFASKSDVGDDVQRRLREAMKEFGFEIMHSLVTNISPNSVVRDAMNEVEASRRMKLAMPVRSEATYIEIVKKAEAQAESSYLSGYGTSRERAMIVKGLKESAKTWSEDTPNKTFKEVMDVLLITQYLDTLAAVGANELIINPRPQEVFDTRSNLNTN